MNFFKIFLFYYSLIAVTVLILVSYFLLPKPQNIANTLILAPVAFLFWVYATNPNSVNASKWSIRFLIVVILFTTLGIFSYFLSAKYLPKSAPILDPTLIEIRQILEDSQAKDEEFKIFLKDELKNLKEDIENINQSDTSTLGISSLDAENTLNDSIYTEAIGKVTIKDPSRSIVQVYSKDSLGSEVMGTLKFGENYPFYESRGNWYLVDNFLSGSEAGVKGWVEATEVKEVNQSQ